MRSYGILAISLLFSPIWAQNVAHSAPPKVVTEHAQDILSSDEADACEIACASIAVSLPSERLILKPDEINYIWSGQQGELTPACRALPVSAKEVSSIFNILKETKCHFAIKSGGHSQHPGASTADRGVTIDLAKMNTVEVSKDRKSVYVGAGSQWLDVYDAVEAEGLLVVGGRVADVGVGGLLTGGGISLLSNKHGWGCDNVLSFEVVLPDGTIANVDQKHDPELYRAFRGAGMSNFGIITAFTLNAITPSNPKGFWTSAKVFDSSKTPSILDGNYDLLSSHVNTDPDIAYIHAAAYDVKHDAKMYVMYQFHASETNITTHPEKLAYTSSIETLMPPSISIMSYSNVTKMLYSTNPPPGKRNLYVSFSYTPSRELDEKLTTYFYDTLVPKVKHISGIIPTIVMQPTFSSQQRSTRGGNALGLAQTGSKEPKAMNLALLPWTWDNASDDELMYATIRAAVEQGEAWAKELGVYHPFVYANYAGPWQDVWGGYGEENVKGLRELQRRYDPEEVFVKGGLCGGGFKLNEKREDGGKVKVGKGDVKDEL